MSMTTVIIGVDVGGTNTDAVIVDTSSSELSILAQSKTATTSDVTTGVNAAIHLALIAARKENRTLAIQQVNIGTTHFINAIVEGKRLVKVAVIRLCGSSSRRLPPFSDFLEHLVNNIRGSDFLVDGGYQFDGREIDPLREDEILKCLDTLKKNGEKHIVVSGIFSPVRQEHELKVLELIRTHYPEASVTASHEIGKLGLLERENAAVLNECIKPLCKDTIQGFRSALDNLGIGCPLFLTQNDGTVISEEKALSFPVFTFASGATNSMRGAAFLSGLKDKDALVVDIGGTSTDVGILLKGFPREASAEVKVGGIRTNFRMPDVISIGLGGGSYVREMKVNDISQVKVGPQSAGYRIENEAMVFAKSVEDIGNRVLTATDIAVAADITDGKIGNEQNLKHLDKDIVSKALDRIHDMVSACIDQMRFNDRDLPLILVGGGSILIDKDRKFGGVSKILMPEHFDVANAVGAALSQISTGVDQIVDLTKYIDSEAMEAKVDNDLKCNPDASETEQSRITENARKGFLKKARDDALDELYATAKDKILRAGATEQSITVVDKDDIALSYIPGNATRIKIKLVGDLALGNKGSTYKVPDSVYSTSPQRGSQERKQTVATTGASLTEEKREHEIQEPQIDEETGEWIISKYDIECLCIGAGIQGCGGGGSPHLARLLALKALNEGKKIRVVTASRFLKDADMENDLITSVAFMGAPLIFYEKLITGNETVGALQCLQDIYSIGKYANRDLGVKENVEIKKEDGLIYIDEYDKKEVDKTTAATIGDKKITALMCAEIGGMNCIEPLIVGAEINLPILDCDGMGRAFPELQMFAPFMYGCSPFPATLADDKGRRAVVLYTNSAKRLEDHFRNVVVGMGCMAGVVLAHFNKDEVLTKTVQHSISHAWRIGDTILKARANNTSPVEAVVRSERGKMLIYGKLTDVLRETTGGFNKGTLIVSGLDEYAGKTVAIEFQNEFLVARVVGEEGILACVPDMIALMDADTAQPIPTEEVRYGIRVAVVAMRVSPVMSSEQALKFVGPQAFGYPEDVQYKPLDDYVDLGPIAPK